MPLVERTPTDVVIADLVRTYEAGINRLRGIIDDGLRRGLDPSRLGTAEQQVGDATAAYRARQLQQAESIIGELRSRGPAAVNTAVARAYGAGVVATDRTLARVGEANTGVLEAAAAGRFGGVHRDQVSVMAANMRDSLDRATVRVGENVRAVFARANEIEGALHPAGGPLRGVPFIGRRVDDPYRKVALDVLAQGAVTGDTRRQITATLVRRLIEEGTSDALTGFVDKAGRRWALDRYATMVARTTTREAASRATAARLAEHGHDLVTISSHPHASDECDAYDGQTFSMTGDSPGYDVLDELPPFHPNCAHVLTPAADTLDAYERELGLAAEGRPSPPPEPEPIAPPETVEPPAPAPADPLAAAVAEVADAHQAQQAVASASAGTLDSVADAFTGTRTRALHDAAAAIDQVHRVPADMPRIPFYAKATDQASAEGQYVRTVSGNAVSITVRPSAETPVAIHEIGHFIDHKGLFGDLPSMASEHHPDMRGLLAELATTTPIRTLEEARATGTLTFPPGHPDAGATMPVNAKARKLLDYLLSPREQFARAYETWIAREAGIPSARHIKGAGLEYWSDEDYPTIKRAMERLFRARGLMR